MHNGSLWKNQKFYRMQCIALKASREFFAICTYDSIRPYRLDGKTAGGFASNLVTSMNKNLFQFSG